MNFIVSLQSLQAFVMSQIHDKSDKQKGHLFHCTSVFVTIKAFYKAHVVPELLTHSQFTTENSVSAS